MKTIGIIFCTLLSILTVGIIFMVLDAIWDFISVDLNHKIGETLVLIFVLTFILAIGIGSDNNSEF